MEKVRCADCGELIAAGLSACPECGGHTFKHLPLSEQMVSEPAEIPVAEKSTDIIPAQVSKETPAKSKPNFIRYIPLVIGVVIVVLGVVMTAVGFTGTQIEKQNATKLVSADETGSDYIHSSGNFYVQGYKFGGDYYTESYAAAKQTVEALDSIDDGLSLVSGGVAENAKKLYAISENVSVVADSFALVYKAIFIAVGSLIISIGLATIAFGFAKAFKTDN